MGTVTLDPYLYFKRNCREAMEFYKTIFGGELYTQTFGEGPGAEDPADKDLIIHARLEGGAVKLMASDVRSEKLGTGKIELTIGGEDAAELTAMFDKLSQGGTVHMPLQKQFWGDTYGKLTDKYDVDWAFNITAPKTLEA